MATLKGTWITALHSDGVLVLIWASVRYERDYQLTVGHRHGSTGRSFTTKVCSILSTDFCSLSKDGNNFVQLDESACLCPPACSGQRHF